MDTEAMPFPSFRLDGQAALVTGAAGGLGRAFALALAHAGADVAIADLPDRSIQAEETASAVRQMGRRSAVVPLNVTDLASISAALEQAVRDLGRVDILVNNAGINIRKPAVAVAAEDWDAVVEVNLRGVFFCAQAAARHMISRGEGGKIISIASQLGLVGSPTRAAYSAAKAGVINLSRTLALEWARHNITVNAVAPGLTNTPLVAGMLADETARQEALRQIPLGRIAEPSDIAGAVLFLASPAAAMITGHTLVVDGGWTAV